MKISFFYRTISTPKPEHVSYQYEGMTVIKKSKTTPWAVTYNYFVKVGGKDEVEEFIFNQGQSDFTARTITTGRLAQKGKIKLRTKHAKTKYRIVWSLTKTCSEYKENSLQGHKILRNMFLFFCQLFLSKYVVVRRRPLNFTQIILTLNVTSLKQLFSKLLPENQHGEHILN